MTTSALRSRRWYSRNRHRKNARTLITVNQSLGLKIGYPMGSAAYYSCFLILPGMGTAIWGIQVMEAMLPGYEQQNVALSSSSSTLLLIC